MYASCGSGPTLRWYGPATRSECHAWLDEREAECKRAHGENWRSVFLPYRVMTDRRASTLLRSLGAIPNTDTG
jgi:hypothetical protein